MKLQKAPRRGHDRLGVETRRVSAHVVRERLGLGEGVPSYSDGKRVVGLRANACDRGEISGMNAAVSLQERAIEIDRQEPVRHARS